MNPAKCPGCGNCFHHCYTQLLRN
ncbi:hypothetical protein ACFL35_19805 [Candidatus Riflebacteria bacterium]